MEDRILDARFELIVSDEQCQKCAPFSDQTSAKWRVKIEGYGTLLLCDRHFEELRRLAVEVVN